MCPENEIKLKQGSPLDRRSSSQNKRSISVESHTSRSYPTSSNLATAPIKLGVPTHKRSSNPKHLSLNEILVQNKQTKIISCLWASGCFSSLSIFSPPHISSYFYFSKNWILINYLKEFSLTITSKQHWNWHVLFTFPSHPAFLVW